MSQPPPTSSQSFTYTAQTLDGRPFTGTIDAADSADATRQLQALQLRIIQIDPVAQPPRAKPRAAMISSPSISNWPSSPPPACRSNKVCA